MEQIYSNNTAKTIATRENFELHIAKSGVYFIEVVARTKNEKQLHSTDDEDLRIEIDKRSFPQHKGSDRLFDSPVSFSGGTTKNLKKSVGFLTFLSKGKHEISYIPDGSATIHNTTVSLVDTNSDISMLTLSTNDDAEDGDRRAWKTFALIDASFQSFLLVLTLKRRKMDSDDVKVVVDGEVKKRESNGFRKLWYFISSIFLGEQQAIIFSDQKQKGLHYIELWADRMPTFNSITFSGLSFLPSPEAKKTIEEMIREKAIEFGLDPELMVRVAMVESNLDPNALSQANAKGIFQLTQITIDQIEKLGYKVENPYNPEQNIHGGVLYFKWIFDQYTGDEKLEKTLAAWNWGGGNFPKNDPLDYTKMPKETRSFIKKVLQK